MLLLTLSGCATPYEHPRYPILDWEKMTSEKKSIVGYWEGLTYEGKKIFYYFGSDGNCLWTVDKTSTRGRYEITESENCYYLLITDFSTKNLKDFAFYGMFKLKGNEMMFYGVPVKSTWATSGYPKSFSARSLLLKRKQIPELKSPS